MRNFSIDTSISRKRLASPQASTKSDTGPSRPESGRSSST